MKKTRCNYCEAGLVDGPRGGKHGYWRHTVEWWKTGDGKKLLGSCSCGASFEGIREYRLLAAL